MKRFIRSLVYAFTGWRLFFAREKNGQLQAVVAMLVVAAGFFFRLPLNEWLILLSCIGLVLALEMMNSVIEKFVDHLHPQKHETVKWIKDVAAGAVLWASLVSAIIGALIFIPKIILFFNK